MDYMDRELHEECGVFGIIGHQDASQICYYGLHSLQHRGQEAAGICCENNGKMIFHKGEGLVTEVFNQDKLKELQGNSAIGHVRYSTAGGGGEGTFRSLRYTFGGDHPSQTTHQTVSSQLRVRTQIIKGPYFNSDSTNTGVPASKSPAYPTHQLPKFNVKL